MWQQVQTSRLIFAFWTLLRMLLTTDISDLSSLSSPPELSEANIAGTASWLAFTLDQDPPIQGSFATSQDPRNHGQHQKGNAEGATASGFLREIRFKLTLKMGDPFLVVRRKPKETTRRDCYEIRLGQETTRSIKTCKGWRAATSSSHAPLGLVQLLQFGRNKLQMCQG